MERFCQGFQGQRLLEMFCKITDELVSEILTFRLLFFGKFQKRKGEAEDDLYPRRTQSGSFVNINLIQSVHSQQDVRVDFGRIQIRTYRMEFPEQILKGGGQTGIEDQKPHPAVRGRMVAVYLAGKNDRAIPLFHGIDSFPHGKLCLSFRNIQKFRMGVQMFRKRQIFAHRNAEASFLLFIKRIHGVLQFPPFRTAISG